jgi:hypothetical protein
MPEPFREIRPTTQLLIELDQAAAKDTPSMSCGVFTIPFFPKLIRLHHKAEHTSKPSGVPMGIRKGSAAFKERDVYICYPFEAVMYRWDHSSRTIYVKFYGRDESPNPVPSDNRLFNDALLYGDEITSEEYRRGVESDH